MAGPAALVGRERELSRLMGALGGDARLVLIVGDAGVGKTRFAGEGMTLATAMGTVMVRGECLPLAGTLPLLPVASALSELGGLRGGGLMESALEAAPGFVGEEVGRLLPQVAAGDGGTGATGRGEGWRRERLFAGVAELLAAAARGSRSGLGLVVEDVHWADSETLDFLTFLGRAGRWEGVRVVVTCRGDEAPLGAEVVVDDYDLVASSSGSPLQPLYPVLPQSRDLAFHLVIARSSGGALQGIGEPVLRRLRELRSPGLLMSGEPQEGVILGGHRLTPLPPGRGRLIRRREAATFVQVAAI